MRVPRYPIAFRDTAPPADSKPRHSGVNYCQAWYNGHVTEREIIMNNKQQEAVAALVLNAQKVIACLSRQGATGLLVEEAFEALNKAREAGLIPPLGVAVTRGSD